MVLDSKNIIELYNSGLNTVQIANNYNTYNTSIRRVLMRNNIKLRGNSEIRNRVNDTIFSQGILTREEKYWLGLLITDGCICNNYISLSLKEEDSYQLARFAEFLGTKVNVNKQFNKKYQIFEYQVKARSLRLASKLQSLACFNNKSIDLELYTELDYDILRGIIDGDGSVGVNNNLTRIQICSASKKFIDQLILFFTKEGIKTCFQIDKRDFRKNPLYTISIHKQAEILSLYQKLYCNTDLFLTRKKNRYGCLLEKSKSKLPLNSGNLLCGNPEPSLSVKENK